MTYQIIQGDCLEALPSIASQSVDAVITDPPYPEIDRDYGRLTEAAWWDLMMGICSEVRRILKPSGSAVFILQPNSRKVGSMRPWLWRFMYWAATDWNLIQDVYWWNITAPPTVHTHRDNGLSRPSVKACVWAGNADCFRDQDKVLWTESDRNIANRTSARCNNDLAYSPNGGAWRDSRARNAAVERGGVTPFNVLPIPNSASVSDSGAYGHGAGTPLKLADWWVKYIVPAGGVVVDPFNGAGTMGIAAIQNGASYIGIEKMPKYVDASLQRLAKVQPGLVAA